MARLSYDQEQQLIADTVAAFTAQFGETFRLRAFSGTFRLGHQRSHFCLEGTVQLVLQVHDPALAARLQRADAWIDFGRDAVDVLRGQAVRL